MEAEGKPGVAFEEPKVGDPQEPIDVTPEPAVSTEEALAAKIKADFESLYSSRLKQTEDRLHGAQRINERLQKENNLLKQQQPPPSITPAPTIDAKDPWSGIQDGAQWKNEIERVAEAKAAEKLAAYQAEQQRQAQLNQFHAVRQQCIDQVAARYPQLHPETGQEDDPISHAYQHVVDQHPDLFHDAYGPLAAMAIMEAELKSSPTASPTPSANPRSRSAQTGLPTPRPAPPQPVRLVLTREQKAFCDRHNMKYDEYLRTAAALEQGAVEA